MQNKVDLIEQVSLRLCLQARPSSWNVVYAYMQLLGISVAAQQGQLLCVCVFYWFEAVSWTWSNGSAADAGSAGQLITACC